jgi:hypothetical protein
MFKRTTLLLSAVSVVALTFLVASPSARYPA